MGSRARVKLGGFEFNEEATTKRGASSEHIALLGIDAALEPGDVWMAVMAGGYNFADARGYVLKMEQDGLLVTVDLPEGGVGYALTLAGKEKLAALPGVPFNVGRIIDALKVADVKEAQNAIDVVRSTLGGLAIPYDRPSSQVDQTIIVPRHFPAGLTEEELDLGQDL